MTVIEQPIRTWKTANPDYYVCADAYSIYLLDFTVRTFNALQREGIQSVDNLAHHTETELLNVRGIGPGAIAEIKEKLGVYKLRLQEEPANIETRYRFVDIETDVTIELQRHIARLSVEVMQFRKLAEASSEDEARLFMQEVHLLAVTAMTQMSDPEIQQLFESTNERGSSD